MILNSTRFTRKIHEWIRVYLKADGERTEAIQNVVSRMRRYGPRIKEDLALLERLVQVYESHVKKDD